MSDPRETIGRLDTMRSRHAIAFALVALIVAVAYLPPLSGGKVYYSRDTADVIYTAERSQASALDRGRFQTWSGAIGTGHYLAADPDSGLFSPRMALFFIFSGYRAQTAVIILYALIAGLGAYALGLTMVGKWIPALYMGMLWPLAGAMAVPHNVLAMTSTAWVPWALAAWSGPSFLPARLAGTGLAIGLEALEGDVFGAAVTGAVIFTLSIAMPRSGSRWKETVTAFSASVLGAGLSAVSWVPALFVLSDSRHAAGLELSEVLSFSLHPARLAGLFSPALWGWTHDGSFWGQFLVNSSGGGHALWYNSIYLGLLTPFFAIAALAMRGRLRRQAAWLIALSLVLLLLSFGRYTPVFPWLAENLHATGIFRHPAKFFTWSALLMVCAAGIGMDGIIRAALDGDKTARLAVAAFISYGATLALVLLYVSARTGAIKSGSSLPNLSLAHIRLDMARLLVMAVLAPALFYISARRPAVERFLGAALVLACALDMLSAFPPASTSPGADLDRPSAEAERIRENGPGRLLVDDNAYLFVSSGPRESLKPNWGALDGIEYAIGISPAMPAIMEDLNDPALFKTRAAALFEILAVRYVMASAMYEPAWLKAQKEQGLIKELSGGGGNDMTLFEAARPPRRFFIASRARWADSRKQALTERLEMGGEGNLVVIPGNEAVFEGGKVGLAPPPPETGEADEQAGEITSVSLWDGNKEMIEADMQRPGWLVAREYLMTGWSARVDGDKQAIYYADGIGRAIRLGHGKHVVEFLFKPPGLLAGAVVSTVSLALIIALAAAALNGLRKRAG